MIVEFVGAPGTGKDTLADALCRRLRDLGLDALPADDARRRALRRLRGRRTALASAALAFVVRHPRLVRDVMAAPAGRKASWRERVLVVRRFLRDAAMHRMLRRTLRAQEAAVLSEGLVQRVIGLHVSVTARATPPAVARYVAALPPIDGVVYLQAPLGLCVQRIGARGVPQRLHGRAPLEITRFVAHAAEAAELAARACIARGTPVISANTDASLEGCVAALAPKLVRLEGR